MTNVRLYAFSGTHHEIGVQQGKASCEQIQELLEKIPNFDFVKLMKPRLLPTSLFVMMAKRRAGKLLTNDIFKYYPRQAQRMSGIAEGAETDMPHVMFMQAMELLISKPSYRIEACTTLAFGPSCTMTGETIVSKNFDYLSVLEPYQLTCQTRPKEGYSTLGCKMTPLAGMLDGMNTWDDGYPSGGNYWSGYNGLDLYSGPGQNLTGSDGIGDGAVVLDPLIAIPQNVDHYPLMTLHAIPEFQPSSILLLFALATLLMIAVYGKKRS